MTTIFFDGQPQPAKPTRFDGQPATTRLVEFRGTALNGTFPSISVNQVQIESELTEPLGLFFGAEAFGNQASLSYRQGTLLHATSDAALQDLTNNTRESEVFTTQDHDAGIYVRNPNRILPSVDLTGMSPWNSNPNGANQRAGTLITPRHFALAYHFNIPNGTTIRFVAQDGTIHDRIVTDSQRIFGDLRVGTLDVDLPSTIKPFKVLPEDWRNFVGDQFFNFHVIFATDQEEKLLTKRMNQSLLPDGNIRALNHTLSPFSTYTETIVDGDSGNPIFFIVDDQPVYVSQWHTAISGTPIYPHYAEVEAYIGPNYSLDFIDLSNFSEFE